MEWVREALQQVVYRMDQLEKMYYAQQDKETEGLYGSSGPQQDVREEGRDKAKYRQRVPRRRQEKVVWSTIEEGLEFTTGSVVMKPEGYEFRGVVLSAFHTTGGNARYVVESLDTPGLLHIFNGRQLLDCME